VKPITGARLAHEIERVCKDDLEKLVKRTDIPREGWVSMATLAVDRTGEDRWEEHKEWLRTRAKVGKRFAEDIETQCTAARAWGFAEVTERLEPLSESLRKSNYKIRQILNKNRRSGHNQTLTVLLESILRRKKRFNCWQALSRVMRVAYIAAGRETEAKHITADMLLKTAKRYRREVTP